MVHIPASMRPAILALTILFGISASALASDSGTVNVEIVPAGSLTPTPEFNADGEGSTVVINPGTLTAAISWISSSNPETSRADALLLVEDRRGTADGWAVRLATSASPGYLNKTSLDWNNSTTGGDIVGSVHIRDVSEQMALDHVPTIVQAPVGSGAGIVVMQLDLGFEPDSWPTDEEMSTFTVLIPSAP